LTAGVPPSDAAIGSIARLKTTFNEARQAAFQQFRSKPQAEPLLAATTLATDQLLRALWASAQMPASAALCAVGGYGRTEQFPHSDVDLLILMPSEPQGDELGIIEQFVGRCWDIGLPLGHSVRTIDQCLSEAAQDVTVMTSLLEVRYLCGSRAFVKRLQQRLDQQIDPVRFLEAKVLEQQQRHAKYQDTPYSLEPNAKESPGGLRDLHILRWVARAARKGQSWAEMARHGLMTEQEARKARQTEGQLKQIRAWLHLLAGRREDRLVFDLQAPVARALGFNDGSNRRASEELMQRYYRAAKAATQLNHLVLLSLAEQVQPDAERAAKRAALSVRAIDHQFQEVAGHLDLVDPERFERSPVAMLEAFLCLQQHPELRGMSAPTLRAMWHARDRIDGKVRRSPEARSVFLQILQQPRGITHALRGMNQWSVLGRYLPVFRRIVGRMQHDLFHVYTVDQHILMVVRNVRRFTMAEHAHEYPLCTQLMADFGRPWILYIAALFHDIAKGRGGDHSLLGKADARRFCRNHGLTEADTNLVVFLVEHHLTMSSVAQKQDLSDPKVIERFATLVGDTQHLCALYLLTVADIRGTSPKVWNAWKGKLLEDLYRASLSVLKGQSPGLETQLDARRAEAVRILNLYALPKDAYEELWNQLDIAYFLRSEASDVAWHTRVLYRHAATQVPVVRARLSPFGEGFQLVVYVPDQNDLFARICGYFDRRNLSVLQAQVHTTRHGYALDSFALIDPSGDAHYRDMLSLVETELAQLLQVRSTLPNPSRGRMSRRSRSFPMRPRVELRPDERGSRFLLSIQANDRTGLLYGVARVLGKHGLNLHTARVTTLGERVEDVFLIDGQALSNPKQQLQIETDLLQELAQL
jgi:[protein-PII] uridylyltransferase